MTRKELKAHCLKQIENCEMWAKYKGEEPHGKVYEEHKLILELLKHEPFINKPCVAHGVCHEDKIKTLDKIRAEIMNIGAYEQEVNGKTEFLRGINYCLSIIDKYKVEGEKI